jgi:4-amino-4-deoxy-L-arabinose transferase-like glycosyltransferase
VARSSSHGGPASAGPSFFSALALGLVLAALHVVWLARFRWGYFLDWDEAGYLGIALEFRDALLDGPGAYVDVQSNAGAQPPVVPTSAFPLFVLFGRSVDAGLATVAVWSVLLVVATYGVASRLVAHRWALLAAAVVGTAPVVADYSRLFHFAIPAAALMTSALWALLRSDGLRRTRWVVAGGVLLALMTTARTMTIAYVPAVLAGVAIGLRREQLRNLGVLCAVTAGVAALWWVPSWDAVWPYLRGTGYGAEATAYGKGHSILSEAFWTTDLRQTARELQAPLVLALLACLAVAVPRVRRGLPRPGVVLLACVVLGGWLALASTRNQGTAFDLPWLPALIVLAVAGAAGVPRRELRVGLAAVLVAVCGWNLLVRSGVAETFSKPRLVTTAAPIEGLGFIHAKAAIHGYGVVVPPDRLPALHRHWDDLDEAIARFVAGRLPEPRVGVGTGDWFITETRIHLAGVLHLRRAFPRGLVRGPGDLGAWNALVTADPPMRPSYAVDRTALEAAARAQGFARARTFTAPDGREVVVWVRA